MEAVVTVKMTPQDLDVLRLALETAKEHEMAVAGDREKNTATQRDAARTRAVQFDGLLKKLQ